MRSEDDVLHIESRSVVTNKKVQRRMMHLKQYFTNLINCSCYIFNVIIFEFLAALPLFKWLERDNLSSYGRCERLIRDFIDGINSACDEGRRLCHSIGEDFLPSCDLSVWMRDFKEENIEPVQGVTTGTIPDWLSGSLIRNGPGGLTVGEHSFNHLFDASAGLHRFSIKNGKATYQNRLLRSKTYEKNQAAQRIVVSEFGTRQVPDPCKTIFQRFASFFTFEEDSDNCLVSVYPFGDEVYTLTENPTMYRIDRDTLKTMEPVKLSKYVNIVHHTSHPHVEMDGLVSNLGLSVQSTGPTYTIVQFPHTRKSNRIEEKDGFSEAKLVAQVPSRWPLHPGYMHTFGLTQNYYVIVEQPLSVSLPAKLASNFNREPLYKILKWYEDYPTLIHLVKKETGKCFASFSAEPFFYLHIINQYEEKDHVIIDICAYKNPDMIECMLVESLKTAKQNPDYSKMFRGRPVRFVLPLSFPKTSKKNLVTLDYTQAKAYRCRNGKIFVVPEILCELGCEVPRIHYPRHLGVKYRYFYAISSDVDLPDPGMLIKVDVENKSKITWCETGTFPSEPIFVPSPDGKAEDDGVILSSLLWASDPLKVALLVLDARDLKELSRTVFRTKVPVPKCLHGWFFPQVS